MGQTPIALDPKTERSNRRIAVLCVAFFAGMIGMAYASVPLYAIFCQVTGYGGTTQRTTQYASQVLDRKMTVRFDTNVAPGLPWTFKPVAREVTMKVGETVQSDFTVTNLFDTPTRAVAQFNVTPETAGVYFNKVECFCFNETDLKPGETRTMPVVFYIDPAIAEMAELNGVTTITLSYTYFPALEDKSVANAAQTKNDADTKIGG
jgi:cytochrome c oxidase assembly protein subunit 11